MAKVILNIFTERIKEQETEKSTAGLDVDKDIGSREDNEKEKENTRSGKDATARNATARDAMVRIAADCNNVLKFLQEISLKAPQVLM